MYSKDLVSNASTGLMAIKDIATYKEIPINIHFADHWIHVIVGFGTSRQKKMSFYTQDCYRGFAQSDKIYNWIEKAVDELKGEADVELYF